MASKLKMVGKRRKKNNETLNRTIWFVCEIRMEIYRLICVAFLCSQTVGNDDIRLFMPKYLSSTSYAIPFP